MQPKVEIENLENGDVVFHEIVLLKGKVLREFSSQLFISCNGNHTEFVLNDDCSQFTSLIQLELGENIVQFGEQVESFRLFLCKPEKVDRMLRAFYVVLKDEIDPEVLNNVNSNLRKISLAVKLLQLYIAEELNAKFGARKSFILREEENNDGSGSKICTDFRSKYSSVALSSLSPEEIYWKIAEEIVGACERRGRMKYLAFLSCTKFVEERKTVFQDASNFVEDWVDQIDRTQFYVNFSVGDVAVVNGGGIYAWPDRCQNVLASFLNVCQIPSDRLNDSAGRNTFGGVFATTLGLSLHELGHVFNLVHNSVGIMGRDFDNIQLAFIGENNKINLANQRKSRHRNCNFSTSSTSCLQRETFYHFADSALFLLNCHSWLNPDAMENVCEKNLFRINSNVITSKHDLIFVELRTRSGDSISFYDLRPFRKKWWIIPSEIPRNDNYDLFVIDVYGCMKGFQL